VLCQFLRDYLEGALAFLRSPGPEQTASIRRHIELATESLDTTERELMTLRRKCMEEHDKDKKQEHVVLATASVDVVEKKTPKRKLDARDKEGSTSRSSENPINRQRHATDSS